jgi:signal transduction histidine kinase
MLTASIAHEVNQPLSGIVTNASTCVRMLGADPPNVEGARETARRTIRDGNRAADVIARLRSLFSKKQIEFDSVDLNDSIKEVIALSLSDIQRNRIHLRTAYDEDIPSVPGNRIQLQQVILNMLRNAIDSMSEIHDRSRNLLVTTQFGSNDEVRVSVEDSGIGIDPRLAERLFEPFYSTKTEGTGIGLSISRSIIEAHHGRIWAAKNDDFGTTFSFEVPTRNAT